MKNATKKRQSQLRAYKKVKQELEKEFKDNGMWMCFFSGIPFPDYVSYSEVDWHHIRGRKESMLTEKEFLVPVFREYHREWHDKPVTELVKEWWFDGFLKRLKEKDHDMYVKTMYKLQ